MRKNVRQVLETIVVIPKAMLSPLFLIKEHSIVNLEATNKGHGMHKPSLMEPMDGLEITKTAKIGTEKQ